MCFVLRLQTLLSRGVSTGFPSRTPPQPAFWTSLECLTHQVLLSGCVYSDRRPRPPSPFPCCRQSRPAAPRVAKCACSHHGRLGQRHQNAPGGLGAAFPRAQPPGHFRPGLDSRAEISGTFPTPRGGRCRRFLLPERHRLSARRWERKVHCGFYSALSVSPAKMGSGVKKESEGGWGLILASCSVPWQ